MVVNSLVSIGVQGLKQSQAGAQKAAGEIVKAGVPTETQSNGLGNNELSNNELSNNKSSTGDITNAVVDLKVNQQLFDASARIVEAGDKMTGTLLNITA